MIDSGTVFRTLACVSAAIAALTLQSQAQWTQTAGPQGAVITALATSSQDIFAGVYDDIYRYEETTDRWVRTGSLSGVRMQHTLFGGPRFVVHGDGLFVTTTDGIVRSTDRGVTWSPTRLVGSLFRDESALFATDGETLHRFDATVGQWQEIGAAPQLTGIPTLFGSSAFTTTLYGSDVFRSDDGMRSWHRVEMSFPLADREATAGHGVMFVAGGDRLYASVGGAEIFRSSDGERWENITLDLPDGLGAREMYADADELVLNDNHGVHRFDGARWTLVEVGPIREIAFAGDRTLLSTHGGVRVLAGDGRTSEPLDGGLVSGSAYALHAIGDYVLASTPSGLFRTVDKGASWQQVAEFSTWMQSSYADVGGVLFTAAGVLYQSSDSGASWSMSGPEYDFEWEGPPFRTDINGVAGADGIVYVGAGSYLSGKGASGWASGGVWSSSDAGESWREISSNLPHDGFTYAPVGGIVATRDYLLITNARGIFRSTDRGESWRPSMSGLPLSSQYIGHAELMTLGRNHYLRIGVEHFESEDGGLTWRPMSAPIPAGYMWSGAATSVVDGRLYVVSGRVVDDTTYQTRLLRFDGRAWEDITATMPEGVTFQSFTRAGAHVYAGSIRHGVWRGDAGASPSSVSNGNPRLPEGSLRCVPNPAAHSVGLAFLVPVTSTLTLSILDARGELVRSLDLGHVDAGSYEIRMPLDGLAGGAYFARIAGGDWSASTMMVKAE